MDVPFIPCSVIMGWHMDVTPWAVTKGRHSLLGPQAVTGAQENFSHPQAPTVSQSKDLFMGSKAGILGQGRDVPNTSGQDTDRPWDPGLSLWEKAEATPRAKAVPPPLPCVPALLPRSGTSYSLAARTQHVSRLVQCHGLG